MTKKQNDGAIAKERGHAKKQIAVRHGAARPKRAGVSVQRVDRLMLRGWAITGIHGAYYAALQRTRAEAINFHCSMLGKTWDYCKKKGDRCERAEQRSIGVLTKQDALNP